MARETELATSLWLPVVGHFISLWFSGVVMTQVTKDIDLASSSRACDKERSHHWTDDFTWFLLPFMLRLHILLPRNATASETVTWGHSWTLQCKSQVVWFGRAKGKHSVFSLTGSLNLLLSKPYSPTFRTTKCETIHLSLEYPIQILYFFAWATQHPWLRHVSLHSGKLVSQSQAHFYKCFTWEGQNQ